MSRTESYLSSKIKNPKLPLVLSVAAALAIDFAAVLILALSGLNARTFILPLVSMILDALFLIVAATSNFRFKYSMYYFAVYTVCVIGLAAGTVASFVGVTRVMSVIAIVAWLLAHAIVVVFSCILQAYAAKRLKGSNLLNLVFAAIFAAIALATAVLYGLYLNGYGFFGQGRNRPIMYEYDEETQSYLASEAFDGNEDTLIIPQTFNGKPVSKVSGKLLAAHGIATVRFDSDEFEFVELDKLASAHDVRMEAQKPLIDNIKKKFYENGVELSSAAKLAGEKCFDFANAMIPVGLDDGEIYVTFKYSLDSYKYLQGEIIPTWFGGKGDVFKVSEIEEVDAFSRRDSFSDADLDWNFKNSGRYIFRGLYSNGADLDNRPIIQSLDAVEVEFDKIYRVYVGASNDYAKYKIADDLKFSTVNGTKQTFKYLIAKNADAFLTAMDRRDGFNLSWKAGSTNLQSPFTSLSTLLNGLSGNDVNVYPVWEMKTPTIDRIVSDNYSPEASSYQVTYGEKLEFTCEATAASGDFALAYKWTKGSADMSLAAALSISSIPFDGGGTYAVEVTTTCADSDLSATATMSVIVHVNQRTLHVAWTDPQSLEYSALDKTLACALNAGDIINDDVVTWENNASSGEFLQKHGEFTLHKSGSYTARIKLSGADGEKYKIATGEDSHAVTITRFKLHADWSGLQYTYDGDMHTATVSVTGLLQDEVSAKCDKEFDQKGDYGVKAILQGADKDNYEIENDSETLKIDPQPVTLTWSVEALVYNGEAQHPNVTSAEGLVKEETVEMLDISYHDCWLNKDAGEGYSVTASLGNQNYIISQDGNAKHTYSIGKKAITLEWGSLSLEYTAYAQAPEVTGFADAVQADRSSLASSVTYSDYASNIDVGDGYSVTADINNDNYEPSEITKTYSITQTDIDIVWSDLELVYNGYEQSPRAEAHGLGDDVLSVSISGGEKKDVESYDVTATLGGEKAKNYRLQNGSEQFEITPRPVRVQWGELTHEYDGAVYQPTATVQGVGDDGDLVVQVTGEGKDANTYPVSVELTDATAKKNYELQDNEVTLTVTRKTITLVWSTNTFVYTALAQAPTVTDLTDVVPADKNDLLGKVTYSGTSGNIDVYDAYTVTASIDTTNYDLLSTVQTYSITQASVTIEWSSLELVYNGYAQSPIATAKGLETDRLEVVLQGAEQKNVGDHAVTASLSGAKARNYSAQDTEKTFKITPCSVNVEWSDLEHEYIGAVYKPTAKVTGKGEDGVLEVTVTASGRYVVGVSYEARAELSNSVDKQNYTLFGDTAQYKITKKKLAARWLNTEQVYAKTALLPSAEIDKFADDDVRVKVSGGEFVNVGEYQANGELDGAQKDNYELTNPTTRFDITKKPLKVTWNKLTQQYNNTNLLPEGSVEPIDGDNVEVVVTGEFKEVGRYPFSGQISGAQRDNYSLTNNEGLIFEIVRRQIKLTTDIEEVSEYNGKARAFKATGTTPDTSLALGHNIDELQITFPGMENNKDVDTYTISAKLGESLADSYEILENSFVYTIKAKAITLVWSDDALTENGSQQRPRVERVEGLAEGDDVGDLKITYSDEGNVSSGSYSVQATVNNKNYVVTDGSDNKTYDISPAARVAGDGTFVAHAQDKRYAA